MQKIKKCVIDYEVNRMNLEKIKNIIIENKKYAIVIVLLVLGGVYYFNFHRPEVNNSNLLLPTSKDNQTTSYTKDKSISSSSNNLSQINNAQSESMPTKVTCDISGAVKHGGIYTLKQGSRLIDLIEVAGGLTEKAQIKVVNRAQLLKDQDQIYIPHEGEEVNVAPAASNSNNSSSAESGDKEQVHLNSATVEDLQKLSGIGQKRAEQIIEFRDSNGGFKQIEDITKVSGIGDKTFEKLKDQLSL